MKFRCDWWPKRKTYWYVSYSTGRVLGGRHYQVSLPWGRKVRLDANLLRTMRQMISDEMVMTPADQVVITFFARVRFWNLNEAADTDNAPLREMPSGPIRPLGSESDRGPRTGDTGVPEADQGTVGRGVAG